uniref:apoptosis-associated speck-like protein containing a CARD isoform X2 n=1 Tax=Gasterosteus aculeatus aculeatus TaxID=481459 RepID=UPI001A990911|nr:apoptosis-associated speck-like protein containing a CARD isoform X2 [Gasterosteus aculeatus aculeatus]
MPPKTTKKAIRDALANLPKDDFEAFCHALIDRPGPPNVPYNKVEGKSFLLIADVLMSTFTEAKAPSVTAELLEEIGCKQQATQLPGAAGVNTTARHGRAEKHFVDEHRTVLIDRVTNVASILDDLLHEEVISKVHYDEIMALSPRQSQMRKLYDPLYGAGRAAKEVFFKSLQAHENHLIQDLQKKE